jgi:hypothetical protein
VDISITAVAGISRRRAERLRDAGFGTIFDLAAAAPADIRAALIASADRVGLAAAEKWVAEARAIEATLWHRSASFVVSFEERGDDGVQERRTVVEQTELDTDPAPTEDWPGWECSQLCDWIRARLSSSEDAPVGESEASAPLAPEPPPVRPRGSVQLREPYRIRRTELVAVDGQRTDLIEDGQSLIVGPVESPSRVTVWIEPAPRQPAMVAARVVDGTGTARVLAGPAEVPVGQEKIELAVTGVLPGIHEVTVVAWDPDALAPPGQAMATFTVPAAAGSG